MIAKRAPKTCALVILIFSLEACPVPEFKYPPGAPRIERFAATPFSVVAGEKTTIAWKVIDADAVAIQGLGTAMTVPLEGSLDVSVASDLHLVLTATNAAGSIEARADVTIEPRMPVEVLSLALDRDRVAPGEPVAVSWSTVNASRVDIRLSTGMIISDDAPSMGTQVFRPSETAVVELRAEGFPAAIVRTVSIDVRALDPIIDAFRVMPRVISTTDQAIVSWTVEHAIRVRISRSTPTSEEDIFSDDAGTGSGSLAVSGMTGTSTLTIFAMNSVGTATATTILYVTTEPAPAIIDFTVTPTITGPAGDVLIRWSTVFADAIEIDSGGVAFFPILPASGTRVFTTFPVPSSGPIDVRLQASRGIVSVSADATVFIDVNRPYISADAPIALILGETATISWSTRNADRIDFSTDTGAALSSSTNSSGTFQLRPVRSTTIFADATNSSGTSRKILPIAVGRAPKIDQFTVSSTIARAGRPVEFEWATTDAIRGRFLGSRYGNLDLGARIAFGTLRRPAPNAGTATVGIDAESELFEETRSTTIQIISAAMQTSEAEPNDISALANGLYSNPSNTIDGQLDPPDDRDAFAFAIPRGLRLLATTDAGGLCGAAIELSLWDDSRKRELGLLTADKVGTFDACPSLTGKDTASIYPQALISLRRASMTSTPTPYRLTVTFEPTQCGDQIVDYNEECDDGNMMSLDGCSSVCTVEGLDELEPNDTFETATSVSTNRAISAWLALDDIDDLAFTTGGGPASIAVESTGLFTCALDARLRLFRASDRLNIATNPGDGVHCPTLTGLVLAPGRYFLEIAPGDGGLQSIRGAYTVTIVCALRWARDRATHRALISTVEKVLFLKSIDLFSQLPGEELVRVAQIAEEVQLQPKETVITEGEIGDSMYLIIDGRVEVLKGKSLVLELGARECVGEMAILDSEPRSATVRAATPVSALKIEREDFYDLLTQKLELAQGIIKVLTRRLRNATRGQEQPR